MKELIAYWCIACLFMNFIPFLIAGGRKYWKLWLWCVFTSPAIACLVAYNIRDKVRQENKYKGRL